MELESVHNNAKLLSEMLDSYNCNETSTEDLELMKELYQACERLKPIVLRLANETQDNEGMLGQYFIIKIYIMNINILCVIKLHIKKFIYTFVSMSQVMNNIIFKF